MQLFAACFIHYFFYNLHTELQMFVFFNVRDEQITVKIDGTLVGSASDSNELAQLLAENNVTNNDGMFCSSDVDFASEEGFASDGDAHDIINEAIELLA